MKANVSLSQRIQIALLIGALCLFAFFIQNMESWHRQNVLSEQDAEIVFGKVTAINLVPSNTTTTYMIDVSLESGEIARLRANIDLARQCPIGSRVQIAKRGLDYRWTPDLCLAERSNS